MELSEYVSEYVGRVSRWYETIVMGREEEETGQTEEPREEKIDPMLILLRAHVYILKHVVKYWVIPYIDDGTIPNWRSFRYNRLSRLIKEGSASRTSGHRRGRPTYNPVSYEDFVATKIEAYLLSRSPSHDEADLSNPFLAKVSGTLLTFLTNVKDYTLLKYQSDQQILRYISLVSLVTIIALFCVVLNLVTLYLSICALFIILDQTFDFKISFEWIMDRIQDQEENILHLQRLGDLAVDYISDMVDLFIPLLDKCFGIGDRTISIMQENWKQKRTSSELHHEACKPLDPKRFSEEAIYSFNQLDEHLRCPISYELFWDPVVCNDGYTYERESLLKWFDTLINSGHELTSPMTGESVDARVVSNKVLWCKIDDVIEQKIKLKRGVSLQRSTTGGIDHFSQANVDAIRNPLIPNLKSWTKSFPFFSKSGSSRSSREK